MAPSDTLKVFAHRINADQTADSICLFCFATVATAQTEQELDAREATHICRRRTDFPNTLRPYLVAKSR
jgi:hypothetical protein